MSDQPANRNDASKREPEFGGFEPLPLEITQPERLRLSFSRVDTYQNCGLKYRFAYVDKLPTKPSPQLSFGKSVHSALEAFYDRKLPELPPVDLLLDTLYDTWDTSGFAELSRDEQTSYYRHAQDVLRRFYDRVKGTYRLPMATEQWFEMPMGENVTVVGSIDRVDVDDNGALHVIDYKTNRKAKTYRDVSRSLQLSLYALACEYLYGRLPETVALDFVVPGASVAVPVGELDLNGAKQAVQDAAAAIRAEAFEAKPNPLCGWCDFKALCPAWSGPSGESLAELSLQLESERRRLTRDVATFRTREEAVARLQAAQLHRSDKTGKHEGEPDG